MTSSSATRRTARAGDVAVLVAAGSSVVLVGAYSDGVSEISPAALALSLYAVGAVLVVVDTVHANRARPGLPLRTLALRLAVVVVPLVIPLTAFGRLDTALFFARNGQVRPGSQGRNGRRPDVRLDHSGYDAFSIILLLLLVLLFGYAVWRTVRRIAKRGPVVVEAPLPVGAPAGAPPVQAPELADQATVVRAALLAGRQHLADDSEPRHAVVAAYAAFEAAVSARGLGRSRAETQREHVTRLLGDGLAAEPGSVETLVDLFNRARFSELPVTTADAATARVLIDQLVPG